MVAQTSPDEPDRGRSTRGRFPRYPLNEALKLVEVVCRQGQGESVRRTAAFDALDRSVNSSSSHSLQTAAIRGYGLLRTVRNRTFLEPTELGSALVKAESEAERLPHAWEAMSSNDIFQSFVDRYGDRPLPSDQVVIDVLMDSFELNAADAKTCLDVFIANLADYGLIEEEGGTRVITPPEFLPSTTGITPDPDFADVDEIVPDVDTPNGQDSELTPGFSQAMLAANSTTTDLVGQLQPQIAFNIQIQLPEDASTDTYEAIFKNISVHLLGRTEE